MKGRGLGAGTGLPGNGACEKVAGSQSSGRLVEQAGGAASRKVIKEKRGGQPGRRKVAEQRKWHGRSSCKTWSSRSPVPGSAPQGRPAVDVAMLQCSRSSLVPGRRGSGREAKRKGGRAPLPGCSRLEPPPPRSLWPLCSGLPPLPAFSLPCTPLQ